MVLMHETDQVVVEGIPLIVKQANIDTKTADTVIPIVSAVEGKKIKVITLTLISDSDNKITFKSNSTSLGGQYTLKAGVVLDVSRQLPNFILETQVGEALGVRITQAVQTTGSFNYIEVG
jgi:ribosomal protein L24